MNAGRGTLLLIIVALLLAACTSSPQSAVQVPTLAAPPPDTAIPTTTPAAVPPATIVPSAPPDTRIITRESELYRTQVAIEATQTALSIQPDSPTIQDCGAVEWWNFAGGSAIDFMNTLEVLEERMDQFDLATPTSNQNFGFSTYRDQLDANHDAFQERDYPLCAKAARDDIDSAMYSYNFYVFERTQQYSEFVRQYYEPEKVSQNLEAARAAMRRAAAEIQALTGMDAAFLVVE